MHTKTGNRTQRVRGGSQREVLRAERRRGVIGRPEHGDLLRGENPTQRLVRREPGEAGAHDGDLHYFTEPASSP